MGVIYLARNRLNGKRYVGKTMRSLSRRRQEHDNLARKGSKCPFHAALAQYGPEGFEWTILVESENEAELFAAEKSLISTLGTKVPNGYNLTDGGDGVVGHSQTAETREKISRSSKGKKKTPEHCANIGKSKKGYKHTPEARAKMSASQKGKKPSPETVAKRSESLRGKKYPNRSQAWRDKIGEANKGRKHTPEAIAKIREASTGRKHSPEAREKIRSAAKEQWRKVREEKARSADATAA